MAKHTATIDEDMRQRVDPPGNKLLKKIMDLLDIYMLHLLAEITILNICIAIA